MPGEAPPGLHDRPDEDGEQEAVAEQRERVAPADGMLGVENVGGVGSGVREREQDAEPVEREAAPHPHHEHEADERQRQRRPEAPADALLLDEARPQGDEERAEEDEYERDPDLEPPDREQVQEL